MKRILALLLIVVMVPLFMGLFCPCAQAVEPVDQPSFTRVPCHGCCAEISAVPDLVSDQIQNAFLVPFYPKISNVLKVLNPGESRRSGLSRRVSYSAAGKPFASSEVPLYLAFRTLLI